MSPKQEDEQVGGGSLLKTEVETSVDGGKKTNTDKDKDAAADKPTPNSEPRETGDPDEDTYTYRDFATIPAPNLGGASLHPQSLQAQKLPAKLASILSDPDLTSVVLWLPHGRSWRVLNRDLFAEHALPRYFGHTNYASFVRIVNAWGFRRITRGPDRDSYYHELFLRGRPDLHQRMKRLSTCHRKTPVNKDDKCPDFYDLAKTSPLPEVSFRRGGQAAGGGGGMMPEAQLRPGSHISPLLQGGVSGNAVGSLGNLGGGGQMGNISNEQMLSLLTNDSRSMNSMNPMNAMNSVRQSMTDNSQPSLPRLAQLQRDNEDLRRRIMEMENGQSQNQRGRNQQVVPDQLAALSANIGGGTNAGGNGGGGGNDLLERELQRMQRDFMMHSNTPMNNSMNNSLLSSLGGAAPAAGGGGREFSFMTGFPREEQLLRAMRLENQIGFRQQQQMQSSQQSPAIDAFQHQQSNGSSSSTPMAAAASMGQGGGGDDDRRKAMMDWVNKQQQHGMS
ncbi:hypothetical protein ACHAXR_003695 [Thalassiosira sp. AJA248-18]